MYAKQSLVDSFVLIVFVLMTVSSQVRPKHGKRWIINKTVVVILLHLHNKSCGGEVPKLTTK